MTKYAEQIAEIAETVARIDERTKGTNQRLDKLNASQGKQWDAINENRADIRELKTRMSVFAGAQTFMSALFAAVAGWFGAQR